MEATPILHGWINTFRLVEAKSIVEALDGWLRHRLRTILWRQWKRPRTRHRKLLRLGFDEVKAWKAAYNGPGPRQVGRHSMR